MNAREEVLNVPATDEAIDAVNEFIDKLLDGMSCAERTRRQLDLAVEEIFVNISRYAYSGDGGEVTIRGQVSREPPCPLTLTFEDSGREFNPVESAPPDLSPAVRRHQKGGLGIFLARSMADVIDYERRDGKNFLTIKKNMYIGG